MLPPQNPAINPKNNIAEFQRYFPENSADSIQNVGAGLAPALKVLSRKVLIECSLPKPQPSLQKIIALNFSGIPWKIPLIQSKTYKQGLPSPIS
jgi:hypothetical protein